MKKIIIFASGRGSNAEVIYRAIQDGVVPATLVAVISDCKGALVLDKAKAWGIPTKTIVRKEYETQDLFDQALVDAVAPFAPDGIVLAGFMRLLGPTFIEAYENRILNIHPSLLPSFPGLKAQQQAVDAGVKISGCTIHFVDAGMDTGPIIMQVAVPVFPDDTGDTLAQRILPIEHETYEQAIALFCQEKLRIRDKKVSITE